MNVVKLQQSLARKALYQPNHRFDDLFSLVAHPVWLRQALDNVLAGRPVWERDLQRFDGDRDAIVRHLTAELKSGNYRPGPVRKRYIRRWGGEQRPIGLPNLEDAVVQECVRMALEPLFESRFLECSVGFRPRRHPMDAVYAAQRFTGDDLKMWWVLTGSLPGVFEAIPHRRLKTILRRHIRDRKMLALLADILGAGVIEQGSIAKTGSGVVVAGILGPLLLNLYLHELDIAWWERYGRLSEAEKAERRAQGLGNVEMIRYGDRFLWLTNGSKAFARELRAELDSILADLELEPDRGQRPMVHLNDGLDFLGYRLKRLFSREANAMVVLVKPPPVAVTRFRDLVRAMTARDRTAASVADKIRQLNRVIRLWGGYYRYANVTDEFTDLSSFVHMRMFQWLRAKHSNVKARRSVRRYVIKNYRVEHEGRATWGADRQVLISMRKLRRHGYTPQICGNPYLEGGPVEPVLLEQTPFPVEIGPPDRRDGDT